MGDDGVRPAELRCAGETRAILTEALAALQDPAASRELEDAAARVAAASRVMYELERDSPISRGPALVRTAMNHLGLALDSLQHAPESPFGHDALEAVARAMAVLYPLLRSYQRQPPRPGSDAGPPDSLPFLVSAPEPSRRAPERAGYAGRDKRAAGERIFLEVDIGLFSESRFFAGISRDISDGGLFVASFEPRAPGTHVALHFVLPNGRAVLAKGVVRWSNTTAGALPTGMGVEFEELSEEDLAAIRAFCRERPPLPGAP